MAEVELPAALDAMLEDSAFPRLSRVGVLLLLHSFAHGQARTDKTTITTSLHVAPKPLFCHWTEGKSAPKP